MDRLSIVNSSIVQFYQSMDWYGLLNIELVTIAISIVQVSII